MSASVKVPLGLLELQAFHKWDISLWLEQHTPQQVMSLSYKKGTLSHLLELQSFSNKMGQPESSAPTETDSYHGHPYLAIGSSVVPQGHRGHVVSMPGTLGDHRHFRTY